MSQHHVKYIHAPSTEAPSHPFLLVRMVDRQLSDRPAIQSLWRLVLAVLTLGQPLTIPSVSVSTSVKGEAGRAAGKD